jgi:hypothetical protein
MEEVPPQCPHILSKNVSDCVRILWAPYTDEIYHIMYDLAERQGLSISPKNETITGVENFLRGHKYDIMSLRNDSDVLNYRQFINDSSNQNPLYLREGDQAPVK